MIAWQGVGPTQDDDDLPALRVPDKAPSAARLALELPLLIVVAAIIAIAVKAVLAQAFFIPSASMDPQLEVGDRVVVSRLAYRFHEPRRGDVLVFDDPTAADVVDDSFIAIRAGREALEALGVVRPRGKELIKRVIGLPGESVAGVNGRIQIDGVPLFEPYLPPGVPIEDFGPVIVPDDHVFMMGDNRGNSKDSRRFGPVDTDLIVGRAISRVWPPGRIAFL